MKALLKQLVSEMHSYGREHKVRRYINLREVEKFADVEKLKTLTAAFQELRLQGIEKVAIREFRKALSRRAEGKADDAWRHDREDSDEEAI